MQPPVGLRNSKAAAVLLVSDKPNDSDVLLVSFELEQMLSEIPPGHHAPKVSDDHALCTRSSAMFNTWDCWVLVSK